MLVDASMTAPIALACVLRQGAMYPRLALHTYVSRDDLECPIVLSLPL